MDPIVKSQAQHLMLDHSPSRSRLASLRALAQAPSDQPRLHRHADAAGPAVSRARSGAAATGDWSRRRAQSGDAPSTRPCSSTARPRRVVSRRSSRGRSRTATSRSCPNSGDLRTKETFGDVQLHVEWAAPAQVRGDSQNRGNSGIFLQGRYEVQVLDSFDNLTYPDGQAGAIYGQWPPLVNAVAQARRVAVLRHRLRGAALRRQQARRSPPT